MKLNIVSIRNFKSNKTLVTVRDTRYEILSLIMAHLKRRMQWIIIRNIESRFLHAVERGIAVDCEFSRCESWSICLEWRALMKQFEVRIYDRGYIRRTGNLNMRIDKIFNRYPSNENDWYILYHIFSFFFMVVER